MNIEALAYDLPPGLIATRPAEPRDRARMLVVRCQGGTIEHASVHDLPELLEPGDLLVRNDTAVLAARLLGTRASDGSRGGGRVEGLFLKAHEDGSWTVVLTASGTLGVGEVIELVGPGARHASLRLLEKHGRYWRAAPEPAGEAAELLEALGRTPLPPYILKARRARGEIIDDASDRQWYRTLFARADRAGSVAAPTAGLHLTDQLRARLEQRGVRQAAVTLHVGEGTFRPVTAATLEDHRMHAESWLVEPAGVEAIRRGPGSGGRFLAVGTTTTRLLESLPEDLPDGPLSGSTDLLISPGYSFRRVDGLLTNFHLPRSTLLALVAARTGLELMHEAYRTAVAERYRFYSYGDAMLILP
jgi:S-adenosylmethionine:tRNA ribosyltransferase-isomerase